MCTHGSGCTFASAITAGLAKGLTPPDAVKRAKDYVTEAIRKGLSMGSGHGPINHLAGVSSEWQSARDSRSVESRMRPSLFDQQADGILQ